MMWLYLIGLLIGIAGLLTLDWRYRLALWRSPRPALMTLGVAVGLFIIWDLLGIGIGIFFHGHSPYGLPLRLAPEFPLEEIFFLFLLNYTALLLFIGVRRWR